jgi:TonB family protein
VGSHLFDRLPTLHIVHYELVHYPGLAVQTRISGSVKLRVVVDRTGSVVEVTPLAGHPLLVREAKSNIERWKFEPLDSAPIDFELTYDFALRGLEEDKRNEWISFGSPQDILVLASPPPVEPSRSQLGLNYLGGLPGRDNPRSRTFDPPPLFCKSMIRGDFKSLYFVRADSKGLTGAFFVRVSFKGLSKIAPDSKGVICRELGQFRPFRVRASSKGLSKLAIDSRGVIWRESAQVDAYLVRVRSKGLSSKQSPFWLEILILPPPPGQFA